MTDHTKRAEDYADIRLTQYPWPRLFRSDVRALIAEAYEQGWVDRSRYDINHAIIRHSNYAPDCTYFECGYCRKGLPETECNITKCVCYITKRPQQ